VTDVAGVPVVPFADRLADAVERKRTQVVVGLDPVLDMLPVELRGEATAGRAAAASAVQRFCTGIVDAVAPYVVAVKPQVAFFEALGSDGWRALEHVSTHAREAGLLVIGDAKRGDVGSTARAYAAAFLERRDREPPLVDALTVSPFLGRDSLDPFFAACRRDGAGLFVLVRTSNPGAAELQDAALSDGRPLWRQLAELVDQWGQDLVGARGLSSVGAVVGATVPRIVGEARRQMPRAIILLPGVGAQGATPADVARAFTSGPASALVNASRSVIYAYRGAPDDDWRAAAAAEAARLQSAVWAAAGW
jgi:orotidine-5'-phosphate decarboxylase